MKSIVNTQHNRDESLKKRRIAILGATGSIGRQTIDIIERHPEQFSVTALAVNTRVEQAVELCRRVLPKVLVVCDEKAAEKAFEIISRDGLPVQVMAGHQAMSDVVTRQDVDMVVTATVGYSGLLPTVAAIRHNKDIALANKETLVVAGDYIHRLLDDSTSRIYPVDSEHSAIVQCLAGEDMDSVKRLIITASGGPFRLLDHDKLANVKAADALKHPNWDMGAKITIDSATMMNKAFEIIEAHYLFGLDPKDISAVVHPQSIVHSMVEFKDGAVKAQLGIPDMHVPIAYALGMNSRMDNVSKGLELSKYATLTFEQPDENKFPCLGFARLALDRKGNTACVINAANEIAVDAFLNDKIRFTDIHRVITRTLEKIDYIQNPSLDDYIATNGESRKVAKNIIENL